MKYCCERWESLVKEGIVFYGEISSCPAWDETSGVYWHFDTVTTYRGKDRVDANINRVVVMYCPFCGSKLE